MIQSPKTLEFLQKLKDSGNWNEEYDYSEVDYINKHEKVFILNKNYDTKHLITPLSLLNGTHCRIHNAIDPHNIIMAQFKITHGDRYDYSKVKYINANTDVLIICKVHGEFLQNPSRHKSGNNCQKCVGGVKMSSEKVINDFIKTHGNKYDYSKVKYINAHNKVTITCKIHGDFSQNPQSHKKGGICPECYNEREIVSIIPINEIINCCQLAYASSATSSSFDAYYLGAKVVTIVNPQGLNASPLRGFKDAVFVSTPIELANVLNNIDRIKKEPKKRENILYIDINIPKWKKIFEIN